MKWQRNAVFRAIQETQHDPREFKWEQATDAFVIVLSDDLILRHEPTGYWFSFSTEDEEHHARYSPGMDVLEVKRRTVVWSNQLDAVREWLIALGREITAPNLWEELKRERDLVAELAPVENTPFTTEEQAKIAEQLNEVKEYVQKTHHPPAEQFRELEARLDYLIEAAGRLPRLDWRNALVGVFLSTIIEAILPDEVVRDALRLILRGVGQMFGADPTLELP